MSDRLWLCDWLKNEEDERYREMVQSQACIEIFVIFTAKKLYWVIKMETIRDEYTIIQ